MADQAMLKSILNWSLKQQAKDGEREKSDFKPMSEERRKWLEGALEGIVMNETKRIEEIVVILEYVKGGVTKVKEDDPFAELKEKLDDASAKELVTEKEKGLEELVDRLCQIDNAKFFALNHGGKGKLHLLINYMENENASLRWRAADVFATVVQNNPEPQAKAHELGVLKFFMRRLKDEKDNKVRTKLFYALTSMMRGEKLNEGALKSFLKCGGIDMLKNLISNATEEPKLCKKALFFTLWIFTAVPTLKKAFVEEDLIRVLLKLASQSEDDVDMSEKSLQVLAHLATDYKGAQPALKSLKEVVPAVDKIVKSFQEMKVKDKEDEMYVTERLKLAVSIAVGLRRK